MNVTLNNPTLEFSNKRDHKEYLHKAVSFKTKGNDSAGIKIEFQDKETNKIVEIYLAKDIQKRLENKFSSDFKNEGGITVATGRLENYLQKMWTYNKNETNTVDSNHDGYLDVDELSNSKRVAVFDFNENDVITSVEEFSFKDMFD